MTKVTTTFDAYPVMQSQGNERQEKRKAHIESCRTVVLVCTGRHSNLGAHLPVVYRDPHHKALKYTISQRPDWVR